MTAFAILSTDRNVEVLIAACDRLWVCDATQVTPVLPESQLVTFIDMCVSPNGRLVALLSANAKLSVVSSSFQENKMEFDYKAALPPTSVTPVDLMWCGADSVVAHWDVGGNAFLIMVGPGGKYRPYPYSTPILLRQEMDGLRIISKEKHEFLQAVPPVVQRIFIYGSMAPGTMLFDARGYFEKRDPAADDRIRDLRDNLDMPGKRKKKKKKEERGGRSCWHFSSSFLLVLQMHLRGQWRSVRRRRRTSGTRRRRKPSSAQPASAWTLSNTRVTNSSKHARCACATYQILGQPSAFS